MELSLSVVTTSVSFRFGSVQFSSADEPLFFFIYHMFVSRFFFHLDLEMVLKIFLFYSSTDPVCSFF